MHFESHLKILPNENICFTCRMNCIEVIENLNVFKLYCAFDKLILICANNVLFPNDIHKTSIVQCVNHTACSGAGWSSQKRWIIK